MLTYRLNGTTDMIGVNHDEPDQFTTRPPPSPAPPATATSAQSSPTMVRLEDGAALLTSRSALNEMTTPMTKR
jgi:hypothetical protein